MSKSILVKTLNQIVSDKGKDVLLSGTQVINLFADYYPQGVVEKYKLKSAYEHGIIQELIKDTKGKSDASVAVNKAIQALKDKAFMDEAIATEFIYEIAEVLKLKYTPKAVSTPVVTTPPTTPATAPKISPTPVPRVSSNTNVQVQTPTVVQSIKQYLNSALQVIQQDKKKRIQCIVSLAALLIVVTVLIFVGVDKKNRNDCDLELSSDGAYYIVTGYGGNDSIVVIPESYKGKPVKTISSEFSDSIDGKLDGGVTDVVIPDSVTCIEDYAFARCYTLTSITIPNSVTYMGKYVFYYCTSLTSITIPNSVTYIGEYAFAYCESLYSINFSGTMEQWWNAILDDYTYDNDKSEYRVFCTDGTIYHRPSK